MRDALEELADMCDEYRRRLDGRPLTPAERVTVAGLIERIDGVRAVLAGLLVTTPAEGVRHAHDAEHLAGRMS